MNIKELLDWRHNCFFCGDELSIHPEIRGVYPVFSIQNDWMKIESKFIKFSINLITGQIIEPEGQTATVEQFISYSTFRINFQCLHCIHEGRWYYYSGKVLGTLSSTKRDSCISDLEENVCKGCWSITQYWGKGFTRVFLTTSPVPINIPLIDLKKTTPQQFENKIKTYVVFS